MSHVFLSEVVTSIDCGGDHFNSEHYDRIIKGSLEKILPRHVFVMDEGGLPNWPGFTDQFHSLLPYVVWFVSDSVPCQLSFFVLYRYRSNAFRFFFQMITHWLVPGKRLNAVSFFAADFFIPPVSNDLYTLCEVVIQLEDQKDLEHVKSNLPAMEVEIRLGAESSYQARRILEIRGASSDEKIVFVQEQIAALIRRFPQHFDYDLISEMQHLFVMCRDDFKASRRSNHLTRMICVLFFFRKSMKNLIKATPGIRRINIKMFNETVGAGHENKHVLCIVVGMNFLRDKETFEKKHLLSIINTHIPSAVSVEGSYVICRRSHESFSHLYFEIEKLTGDKFTQSEVALLKQQLPLELRDLIEHSIHPVFMPRNEEDVMRSILILSSQVKYVRDIPQVVINFDEQTYADLFFNVILVQVAKPGAWSVQEVFANSNTTLTFLYERTKTVGFLRNKYTKEAVIFRVKMPKEQFLRRDHSIDLYKARQVVVKELARLMGDIRDFNGGMIAKQNETLDGVKNLMDGCVKYSEHLLENFFFSLMPPVIRTLIEPFAIKTLFLMIQELAEKKSADHLVGCAHSIRATADFVFVAIRKDSSHACKEITVSLEAFPHHPSEVASASLVFHEIPYLGYIYRSDDKEKQAHFCKIIQNVLAFS